MPWKSLFKSWRLLLFYLPLTWASVIATAFLSSRDAGHSGWWSHPATHGSLVVCCLLSGALSLVYLRLLFFMRASTIASAAPGRVELLGRAYPIPGTKPLVSPVDGTPCLGYHRIRSSRMGRTTSIEVDEERVVDAFLLKDETGECLVRPSGAWIDYRIGEDKVEGRGFFKPQIDDGADFIPVGAPICVLGWMAEQRLGAEELQSQFAEELVNDWKRDQPRFLRRFDKNRDRIVDAREWLVAKLAARKTLGRGMKSRFASGVRVVQEPPAGLYYINADLHKPVYWTFLCASATNAVLLLAACYFLLRALRLIGTP